MSVASGSSESGYLDETSLKPDERRMLSFTSEGWRMEDEYMSDEQ